MTGGTRGAYTPNWSLCMGHRTPQRPGRLVGTWPIKSSYFAVSFLLIFFFNI
jgi:hypothetical protein